VYEGEPYNSGALHRRLSTSFNTAIRGSSIRTQTNSDSELINYTHHEVGYQAYYTTMVIRLSDVSDFFPKMPLITPTSFFKRPRG